MCLHVHTYDSGSVCNVTMLMGKSVFMCTCERDMEMHIRVCVFSMCGLQNSYA